MFHFLILFKVWHQRNILIVWWRIKMGNILFLNLSKKMRRSHDLMQNVLTPHHFDLIYLFTWSDFKRWHWLLFRWFTVDSAEQVKKFWQLLEHFQTIFSLSPIPPKFLPEKHISVRLQFEMMTGYSEKPKMRCKSSGRVQRKPDKPKTCGCEVTRVPG